MLRLQFLQHHPQSSSASHPSGVVIFLHGLGAGADDFADLPQLLSLSPSVRYIFPQAPNIPVTVNGGMKMPAWYDIKSMDLDREVDSSTVVDSLTLIYELLDHIVAGGVPSHRILIGGFSQGGAMALEVGLNYSQTLAGIVSLSAYSLSLDKLNSGRYDHQKSIPILCCHGKHDQVVPFELGSQHAQSFKKRGFALEWYQEDGLGHNLSPGEVMAMKKWMERFPFLKG